MGCYNAASGIEIDRVAQKSIISATNASIINIIEWKIW